MSTPLFRPLPRIEQRHFREVADIDLLRFCAEPTENFYALAREKPWVYTVIERLTRNGWKTIGYGLVIPVTAFVHSVIVHGEMSESELRSQHVKSLSDADAFYIASIATSSDARFYESRSLVGYTLGSVLRSPKPVFAVAISEAGDRIAREIGMTPKEYAGKAFRGVGDYKPTLFEKEPFRFN